MASFQIFCLFFFAAVYMGKAEGHDWIKTLPNYGVTFKNEGVLYPTADHWTHYFQLELPVFPFISEKPLPCNNCQWYKEAMEEIMTLHQQNRVQLGTILSKIKTLIPHHDLRRIPNNRHRRSFLPFIGSLAKTLFGTSTTSDLNELSRNVAQIRTNQNKMAKAVSSEIGLFTAAVRNFDDRLGNTFKAVADNHNAIELLGVDFNKSLISSEIAQAKLVAAMAKQTRLSLQLLNRYEELLLGAIDTLQGHLSPLLIPDNVLTNVLHYVGDKLNLHGFFLTHSHPTFYYKNAKFLLFRQFSSIFIEVHFPISDISTRLYSLTSFPIPLNSTSSHGTELVTDKRFFILSSDEKYYAEVSSKHIQSCTHNNHVWHCNQQIVLRNDTHNSCFWSLFHDDITNIDKNCVFHFKQNVITPNIVHMNSSHLLLINITNFEVRCHHGIEFHTGCSSCIISIPCKCSVSTESLFVPKHWHGCKQNNTKSITMVHTVNLILIQQFFNFSLEDLKPNSTFLQPLDVKIPHFTLFTHNFSKMLATEQKASLDIKKISQKAKQNQVIFQTLSETMLDSDAKFVPSFDFTTMLSCISTTIAFLSLLAFVFLFRQYRKLTAIVTVLHKVHKAHTLPVFHYTTAPLITSTEAPFTISPQHLYSTSEVLGILTIIVLSIYLMYKYFKIEKFQLILELSNDHSTVLVPIRNIPYAHHLLMFSSNNPLKDFKVNFGIRSYLYVDWSGLKVEVVGHNTQWNLPSEINLDPLLAYRTHRIISTPFNALLYKRVTNMVYPVSVTDLSAPSAPSISSVYPNLADTLT